MTKAFVGCFAQSQPREVIAILEPSRHKNSYCSRSSGLLEKNSVAESTVVKATSARVPSTRHFRVPSGPENISFDEHGEKESLQIAQSFAWLRSDVKEEKQED